MAAVLTSSGEVCTPLSWRFLFDGRGIRGIFGVVVWSWGAPRDGPGALFSFCLDTRDTYDQTCSMSNRIMVIVGKSWADRQDVTFVKEQDFLEFRFLRSRVEDCLRDARTAAEFYLTEIDRGRATRAEAWLRHTNACRESAAYWQNRISELTSPEYASACDDTPVGTPHG